MKLTNCDRDAFVASAMEDVPTIDYHEKARKLWIETIKASLPVDLLNAITKYPDWFSSNYVCLPGMLQNFSTVFRGDNIDPDEWHKDFPELIAQISEMADKLKEQQASHQKLRDQLRGAISLCNTLKQAEEALPEFKKYLPEDRDGDKKCRQMPVIANLVADLMNAGWPKDQSAQGVAA